MGTASLPSDMDQMISQKVFGALSRDFTLRLDYDIPVKKKYQ